MAKLTERQMGAIVFELSKRVARLERELGIKPERRKQRPPEQKRSAACGAERSGAEVLEWESGRGRLEA